MTATSSLTSDLRRQVLILEADLRQRIEDNLELKSRWTSEHRDALQRGRTSAAWVVWRDDRVTQAAVAWVLTTAFIRFCEDNALLKPVWIAGPARRRQEALDAQLGYFRAYPEHTDREWLEQAVAHLGRLKATGGIVDRYSALHLVSPSGNAVTALFDFWRKRNDTGALIHDFTDATLSTRFLGDLYQDISEYAKSTYALLQTPIFIEEFILDRTLEPALAERPLEGFRLIDPACGSGHFLLGAFQRLLDRWHRHAPGLEVQARVQLALDAVNGVDINPFAVAIARFRLMVAALQACGLRSLEDAPAFHLNLGVGDSLLHGSTQLDINYGIEHDADATLSGFAYETEDLMRLRQLLQSGRYDVVVANPPYITVKDKALNQAYRLRYKSCSGTYALTVPFMERIFDLAKVDAEATAAGWTGQITSNSFMKRQFGKKIIEDFLTRKDLRLVADTSGAYIPGHGTPTVILVGRCRQPSSPTVRAVLGIQGEPSRPDDPSQGVVWLSIRGHVDEPGYLGPMIAVEDLPLAAFERHPWSLSGGGAATLRESLNNHPTRLAGVLTGWGAAVLTRADGAFVSDRRTNDARYQFFSPFVVGEDVRDWRIASHHYVLYPYTNEGKALPERSLAPWLWAYRADLRKRVAFGASQVQRGLAWFEYSMFFRERLEGLSARFSDTATHFHCVIGNGVLSNSHAPLLRFASESDMLSAIGILNSSTACFWLKETSHNKGSTVDTSGARQTQVPWENFYEFSGTYLKEYPLPSTLPLERGRRLCALADQLSRTEPTALFADALPTTEVLAIARREYDRISAQMISAQEELDWDVYRQYGLIDEDFTYPGDDLPPLALGERAFEIALARRVAAGDEETSWFERHRSTPITEIPAHWPPAYRQLVQRRLDLIATGPSIRLLEKPEYKRRWASEPWEEQQTAALRDWLLDRLEDRRFWFDAQGRPTPRSVAQLADEVSRDRDLTGVLALWEGRPDIPVTQSLERLLADETVPFLAAYRYGESGMRKREAWEETWALQRREDAGESVGIIPVPPKYAPADFRRSPYWHVRGKLDVPKERFILYPAAGRDTDPAPLLGWAGWDYAQQSLALSIIIGAREEEGWSDERLVPLVAGLAELQPWVEQWHPDVDPAFGVSLAAFCREQLSSRMTQVGRSLDALRAWRPPDVGRGRRARIATAPSGEES